MDHVLTLGLGWVGIYSAMVLAGIGSMVGCARAGQAACGALLEAEGGYGRFIGVASMPASQSVYGIVITLALARTVTAENAGALAAIGLLGGMALLVSAVYQGEACAAAINVSKNKAEIFGLSIAPAAFIEGFAVFVLAFALVLIQRIPGS
jgi:V/A-type H+-transporting ATPase subunit K